MQEYIQQEAGHTIDYVLLEETGPAHDRDFHVEVRIDGTPYGQGWGKSKKLAQREAAMQALIAYGELPQVEEA